MHNRHPSSLSLEDLVRSGELIQLQSGRYFLCDRDQDALTTFTPPLSDSFISSELHLYVCSSSVPPDTPIEGDLTFVVSPVVLWSILKLYKNKHRPNTVSKIKEVCDRYLKSPACLKECYKLHRTFKK